MNASGDVDFKAPFYLQLREVIRSKIEAGEYLPGTTIPSENELAETYAINRLTVRNAVEALIREGLLMRVQGKGVYVLNNKIDYDLERVSGFTQTIREKKHAARIHIRGKALRPAGEKYALLLGIAPEEKMYCIRRICHADDVPVSLEEIYIPYAVLPQLKNVDLSVFSVYEAYAFYGVKVHHARQTMDIVQLGAKDANTLCIPQGQAVMLFECLSYDAEGGVIEYSRNYTRGDLCNFNIHFSQS